jgi:hypothetical protein
MKRVFIFLVMALASTAVFAQEQKFKVGVFATASEIRSLFPDSFGAEATNYNPNISAELMGTIAKAGDFRFSSGINYRRNFSTDTDTYFLAGQISYHKSVFEPFARFNAGVDRIKIGETSTRTTFSREILLGADLNFGKIYFRPVAVGFKRTGEFLAPAERTFQSGLGFNF